MSPFTLSMVYSMKQVLLACLVLLVAGCQPASGQLATLESNAEGDIQRLSPAYTPTPAPTPLPTLPPTPPAPDSDETAALLPGNPGDVLLHDAPHYWLTLTLDAGEGVYTLQGTARIRYTNTSGEPLHTLAFLLPPASDTMRAGPIMVDGILLPIQYAEDGHSFSVDLPRALSTETMIDITVPFELDVAPSDGVLYVEAPAPLIPRYDDVWQTTVSPYANGAGNMPLARFDMVIDAPADLECAVTGVVVERESGGDGRQMLHAVSGPARLIAVAAGTFVEVERMAGEVLLRAWMLPEHEEEAEVVLQAADRMLALLGEQWVPYPYAELDLVDVPGWWGDGAAGIVPLGAAGTNTVVDEVLTAVATQWTAGLLGSDSIQQPWIREALTLFARVKYDEERFGVGAGTGYLTNLRAALREEGDAERALDQSALDFDTMEIYMIDAGYKGALFLESLRWTMGRSAFNAFLQSLFLENRFGFVSGQELQRVAEEACACDLRSLFELWVWEGGPLALP